jgi:hypothetical protein
VYNDSWYDYVVTADDVNHGWNTIDMNLATGKSSVTLEDLVVEIDH